jgi:hypothetical protein
MLAAGGATQKFDFGHDMRAVSLKPRRNRYPKGDNDYNQSPRRHDSHKIPSAAIGEVSQGIMTSQISMKRTLHRTGDGKKDIEAVYGMTLARMELSRIPSPAVTPDFFSR